MESALLDDVDLDFWGVEGDPTVSQWAFIEGLDIRNKSIY